VAKPVAEAKPASSAASKAASASGAGAARESTAVPGDYTVQVAAVKDRGEAAGIVRQLKTKGYDAFVLSPDRDDRLGMFRVRIGSFKDKRKAEALAQRLLREEKRYKPWVTR
jgi:cell division septation protein DedD